MRRGWAPVLAVAGLLTGGCVSSTDIQGLSQQITDLQRQVLQMQTQGSSKQEVADLESAITQQIQTLLKTEADMRVELGSLSGQMEELQGKLEDTNFRLSQLSQQIATTNQELRNFRAPLSAGPAGEGATVPADPETLYQSAYSDYLRGNYDLAIMAFQQYLQSFPETDLADNALYWIGECFYRQGKFRDAIGQYDQVVAKFPRSDKVPSAQLKKGYALLEAGDRKAGVLQLQNVRKTYPNSDEANLARQRLQALGVESGSRND